MPLFLMRVANLQVLLTAGHKIVMRYAFLFFSLGPLSLLTSYTISVMSGVLLFLEKDYALSLGQKQQLVSVILLGALGGVVLAGPLADKYGRKAALSASAFFYAIGSFLSFYTELIDVLVWARVITGVGVGLSSVVVPLYLAESASIERRGMFVSLFQLAVTLGILLSYGVNYFVEPSLDWRIPFKVALFLAAVAGIALRFTPESPSWLILHHQERKAWAILRTIETEKEIHKHQRSAKKEGGVFVLDLFRKGLLSALFVGIFLSIFQQATGINTVIYYGPTILANAGYGTLSNTLFATLLIGVINVFATILALLWVDRFGRRKLLLIGLMGMALALFTLSLIPSLALFALMAYVIFFAISLGPVVWVIVSEIFPLKFRAKAISLAVFINWLMNYLISYSFLDLLHKIGYTQLYLFFGVISLLGLLFVYFFVPETKGKSLEEIQVYWNI